MAKPITYCTVEDCERRSHGHGLCTMHYKRVRKHGDPHATRHAWSGPNSRPRAAPGTRYVDVQSGYVSIYDPTHPNANALGRVKEHIAVMAAHLGRPLAVGEQVHHRNGVRNDNRLENLALRVGPHGSGITVEEAVAWAHEILRRYG